MIIKDFFPRSINWKSFLEILHPLINDTAATSNSISFKESQMPSTQNRADYPVMYKLGIDLEGVQIREQDLRTLSGPRMYIRVIFSPR